MEFQKDDIDFRKDNGDDEIDWKKDNGRKPFDFDAFLDDDGGGDDLDERVTVATDGRDVLEPDAFGGSVPNYARRKTGGEHGLHEAPAPEGEAETTAENPAMDPSDPRYAAPERPHIVVAEPRPQVVVTPPGAEEYEDEELSAGHGGGGGLKAVAVALAIIALAAGALLFFLTRGGGDDEKTPISTPAPTSQAADSTPAVENTPEPTKAPEETAAPTAPPAATYSINVTAGTGGSVSPSGSVSVREGESVSFKVTAEEGFEISEVLVDGESTSASEFTIKNVTRDHTVYAVFRETATPTPPPTAEPTPEVTPEPTPTPEPEPTDPPQAQDGETEPDVPAEGDQP